MAGTACAALGGAAAADLEAYVRSGDRVEGEVSAGGEVETLRFACAADETVRATARARTRGALRARLLDDAGIVLDEGTGRNVRLAAVIPGGVTEAILEVSAADGAARIPYTASAISGARQKPRTLDLRPASVGPATRIEAETVARAGGVVAPARWEETPGVATLAAGSLARPTAVLVGTAPSLAPAGDFGAVSDPAFFGPGALRTASRAPATLVLRYRPGEVTRSVRVFRASPNGDLAEVTDGVTVDAAQQRITIRTTRLGLYQAFDGPSASDPPDGDELRPDPLRAYDRLGAVAAGATRLVVGAPTHREDVEGTPTEVGAAFVFERGEGGAWTQTATLLVPGLASGTAFGHAVALDGDRIAVGAPAATIDATSWHATGTGAVHVFELVDGAWTATQSISAETSTTAFGASVALDGGRLAVGAPFGPSPIASTGEVEVFDLVGGTFETSGALHGPASGSSASLFGARIALDGDTVLVGAPYEGAVTLHGGAHVFVRADGDWFLEQTLRAPLPSSYGRFGADVALQGDRALVAEPGRLAAGTGTRTGAVHVFERSAGGWTAVARIDGPATGGADAFGASVALDGDAALIGAPKSSFAAPEGGAAYLVRRGTGAWTGRAPFSAPGVAPRDGFGRFVGLVGGTAFVVAPDADGAFANTGEVHVLDVSGR